MRTFNYFSPINSFSSIMNDSKENPIVINQSLCNKDNFKSFQLKSYENLNTIGLDKVEKISKILKISELNEKVTREIDAFFSPKREDIKAKSRNESKLKIFTTLSKNIEAKQDGKSFLSSTINLNKNTIKSRLNKSNYKNISENIDKKLANFINKIKKHDNFNFSILSNDRNLKHKTLEIITNESLTFLSISNINTQTTNKTALILKEYIKTYKVLFLNSNKVKIY